MVGCGGAGPRKGRASAGWRIEAYQQGELTLNAMEETHLTIQTFINGKEVGTEGGQEIHDPFLHNRTTYEPSLWERIKLLFTGKVTFEVRIRGDIEAQRQWFRTDNLPRGESETCAHSLPGVPAGGSGGG